MGYRVGDNQHDQIINQRLRTLCLLQIALVFCHILSAGI